METDMASNEFIQARGKRLAAILGSDRPGPYRSASQVFELLQEFKRTQPALYDAITAYAKAYKTGDAIEAFECAGDIAERVLNLAAGV